ncbi:MAG: maltose ABC transporter substrate-binding protein [Chloroflexi bacterium]|nr:maltose ABC transporter substrate-binding protein [Chloroflexota bacterium]
MKKFLSVVLVITLLAGFSPAVLVSAQDAITLKVWESVGGPDEWIKQAGEAFTKENPNITIEFVNVENVDASNQIALDGPAGIGPDLFAAGHDKLGELVVGGHILPTVDAEEVKSIILASTSQALTYEGTMYGYPTSAETYGLYFNKALISAEEVPTTWAAMKEWVANFNAANPDKYGLVFDVGNIYYTILFTTMNGNRLFGESGTDTSSSFLATPDSIAGMKIFQGLREVLQLPSADATTATADGAFAAGNAAMHISGPWNVSNFTGAGIDFGVTTLPALEGETPASSFSGTRGLFVSAYSEHPEEAAKFARFLLSDEMQQLRYDITGALPSTPLKVESEISQGFINQLQYAFPMPSVPQMGAFWESGGAAAANIWDGADVETELKALDQAIVSFVQQ